MTQALINGFPGVNVAGNNAGLLLNGTGTHQVTVTGASSGRLGQDFTGFFFSSDTNGKVIKFLTNNGTLNEWMRITSAGDVGIGTTTPADKLDVVAPAVGATGLSVQATDLTAANTAISGLANGLNGSIGVHGVASGTSGTTYGVRGVTNSPTGYGVRGESNAASGFNFGVSGFNASAGGIAVDGFANSATGNTIGTRGLAASTSGIGVQGVSTATSGTTYGVQGSSSSTVGLGVGGIANSGTGTATGVLGESFSTGGTGVYGFATASSGGTYGVQGNSSSTSGIGVNGFTTATADNANTNGVQGATASPIGIGVNGIASDTTGGTTKVLGSVGVNGQSNSPNGIGVIGLATDTTPVVVGTSPNQGTIGVQGQSNSPNGTGVNAFDNYQCLLPGCDPSAAGAPSPAGLFAQVLHANGVAVVGVAGSKTVGCAMPTCDPTKTGNAGVLGRSFHPNGAGIAGVARDTSVTNTAGGVFSVGVVGQAASPTSYALYGHFIPATVDVGAAALFNNDAGLTAVPPTTLCTGVTTCTILELQANGIRKFHFDGAGNAHALGTFMPGGADFAESVSVRGERRLYEAGDVMVIDDAGNRSLAKSQEPYSTLVAGIVSTKPGMLASLHNSTTSAGQKAIDAEVPLAVIGIVPCKVSAENGPIHAGDLLVTSSIAGYAMKGTDRPRMLGAVVGKAMQPMQSGKGVIEVLVTLQ
jgi:hypothetical protein